MLKECIHKAKSLPPHSNTAFLTAAVISTEIAAGLNTRPHGCSPPSFPPPSCSLRKYLRIEIPERRTVLDFLTTIAEIYAPEWEAPDWLVELTNERLIDVADLEPEPEPCPPPPPRQ
eukprot:SAG22_NODE_2807_length_2191_cov_1.949331_1_plen_117_part_00